MNRIYKTLWSASTQSWQAVPENARTGGKKSTSSAVGVVASVALGFALSGAAHAQSPPAINQLPTGGTVARGTATFSQTATAQAAAMTVNQSSQRAVINWDTFNLGSKASVNFVQPNAQAVTLNRVNDSNPSQIFGRITANGQVFLTNANGVYFSPTSSVDVGALTATTHSISDDNFMSGKYVFERNGSTGKVINEGNINAALGGYVALLAPEVQNAGVVVARAGTVAMAAGEMITLTVDNNGSLAGITTTPSTIATLVENKHAVLAPDGQIILSAVGLSKLQTGVIKNSGSLEANSISHKGGKVYLEGDDITLTSTSKIEAKGATGGGTVLVGGDWQGSGDLRQATKVTMEAGASIDASATNNGDGGKVVLWSDVHNANSVTQVNGRIDAKGAGTGQGGQVETSGHALKVGDALQVNTGGGQWLLDPYNITISTAADANTANSSSTFTSSASGGVINVSTLNSALTSNNVTVSTTGGGSDTGDITLSSTLTGANALAWATNKTLTLSAAGGVTGSGNIAMSGAGTVIFNQAGNSTYSGVISGNGSFTKDGAGLLKITTGQTYTGGTLISGGTLQLDGNGSIALNTIMNNATLNLNLNTSALSAAIFSNNVDGTGNLVVMSSTYLTGANTYSGTTTINNGVSLGVGIQGAQQAGTLGTGNVSIGTGGLLYFARDANYTWAMDISGGGGLFKQGTGTLTLTGNNTFTGPTTLYTGTLVLGSANALGTAGTITFYGGSSTLQYTANAVGVGALDYSSRINVSSTYSLNVDTGGQDVTWASSPTTGLHTSMVKSGAGTLRMNGSITLPGNSSPITPALTVSGGTLVLAGNNTIGADLPYGSASAAIVINAGTTLQVGNGGNTGDLGGSTTVLNNGTLTFNRNDTALTVANNIQGAGNVIMGVSAGSTTAEVKLQSTGNTYTGGTRLVAGSLVPDVDTTSATSPSLGTTGVISFEGGGLKYISTNDATDYSSRFSTAANQTYKINLKAPSALIITQTWATPLTSIGGALDLSGTGTLILAGNNTYSGLTTVRETSTLQLGNGGTTGSVAGDINLTGTSGAAPATLMINRSGNFTMSNAISTLGTGALKVNFPSDNDVLTLNAANSFSGATAGGVWLMKGSLGLGSLNALGSSSSTVPIYFAGGRLQFTSVGNTIKPSRFRDFGAPIALDTNGVDVTLSTVLGGPGTGSSTIKKYGAGTLTLGVNATYTGDTYVYGGTLQVGTGSAGGAWTTSGAYVASGASLIFKPSSSATISTSVSQDPTSSTSGNVTFNATAGAITYTGTVSDAITTTIAAGTLIVGNGSTTGALNSTGAITNSGTLTFNRSDAQTISAKISGTGALVDQGSGTLTLSGANDYSGATTVNAGTLVITNASGLGTTAAGTTVASGAKLDLQGVAVGSEAITLSGGTLATSTGTSSLSGGVTLTANSIVDVGGTSLTLSGAVSGAGKSLTKNGTGTLVLANANTYGSTVFSAGTLRLANSSALPDTSVTVAAGNTLELGAIDGSNLSVTGKTITLASSGTSGGGGFLHNVAGANTWSGAITLQNNSTVTVDTGTSLNLSSASSAVASGATVFLKPSDGNLTFGTLTGSGGAVYVKSGAGTLSGNFAGLTAINMVYARPVDASNQNSSYYGSTPGYTLGFFSASSGGTQYSLVSGTDYTGTIVYSGAPTATSVPGSYTISYSSGASISNASYYLVGAGTGLTWTVNAKPLTITVASSSKTYDGQAFSGGSVTYSAFANGQTASALTGTLTYGGTAQGAVNASASPYSITASGLSSTNYAITYVDGSLTINKKALTVTAPTVTKEYDGTTSAIGTTTMGALASGDVVNTSPVIAFTDKNAGASNKTVHASGLTIKNANNIDMTGNYDVTYADNTISTITPKALTVTAVDVVKNFGAANPALSVTISGYIPTETAATSGVTGTGLATTTATDLTVAGTVPITASVGTLTASNYAFTRFVDGTLTIKPIAAMNNTEVSMLIGAQLANLTGAQVASFSATQLQVFSPQQLSALSPSQLASMTTAQVLALSPTQIAAISPAKIASMSATELSAFSNEQLQALSVSQIAAITPDHFAAFKPEQIMALSISQVVNLTPDQLRGFTPAQVASLSAAEIAYFDARQLAAIGIFPKAETPKAETPVAVTPPVTVPPVETPVTPVIANSNQLPLNFETPVTPAQETATISGADTKDTRNKFEAAIPVMTDVAASNASSVSVVAVPTQRPTSAQQSAVSAQPTPNALVGAAAPQTGVLAITILSNAEARPVTSGLAFEQDANGLKLRITSAPSVPPASEKIEINDKLTTFMVQSANGDMVEFQGSLVNKRLVIVATSSTARQVARTEMNTVLAAAITSLGAESRVMLANLNGVVLDLR